MILLHLHNKEEDGLEWQHAILILFPEEKKDIEGVKHKSMPSVKIIGIGMKLSNKRNRRQEKKIKCKD
jgi:hypothetical protein